MGGTGRGSAPWIFKQVRAKRFGGSQLFTLAGRKRIPSSAIRSQQRLNRDDTRLYGPPREDRHAFST